MRAYFLFLTQRPASTAGILPFSQAFNLTSLRRALRRPILEWTDVKLIPSNASVKPDIPSSDPALEQFGCWSTRPQNSPNPAYIRGSENILKLDLSFTRIPLFAYFNPKDKGDPHTTFAGLAATILPGHQRPVTTTTLMAPSRLGSKLPPNDHLACFDFLYYVTSGLKSFEFENRWSPVWYLVGRHLKFTDRVMDLGKEYLRRALNVDSAALPPVSARCS